MFPCAIKTAKKKKENSTVCTNNFCNIQCLLIYLWHEFASQQAVHKVLSPFQQLLSHFSPNKYDTALISIKKPQYATRQGFHLPDHSLPLSQEFFHCLYSVSTVQVSFFATMENIYCTLFKQPHDISKWFIPLSLSWKQKTFFSLYQVLNG